VRAFPASRRRGQSAICPPPRNIRRQPDNLLRYRYRLPELGTARPVAMIRGATAGYLAASGTALRAGRFFVESEPTPVALIGESLANRLWPGETRGAVVGRTFRQGDVTGPLIRLAGVVEDVLPGAIDREALPVIYRPDRQWASGRATLVVRTGQESAALAPKFEGWIRIFRFLRYAPCEKLSPHLSRNATSR
jgi:hypothetical protein